MPWKMLTATKEVLDRQMAVEMLVEGTLVQKQMSYEKFKEDGVIVMRYGAFPKVNVQRLLLAERLISLVKMIPYITPRESITRVRGLLPTPYEIELLYRKGALRYRELLLEEEQRLRRLRPEEERQKVRQILLSPVSITLTDQTELARLEKYLWLNLRTEVEQCLEKIVKMVISKSWYVETIAGLEALLKMLLQLYVYALMEHPKNLNMLGMRVTPLTLQWLEGKSGQLYMTASVQGQDIKSKALLQTVQKRKPMTKLVSSERSRLELIPQKIDIGHVIYISKDALVGTGHDFFGKDFLFTALRYAYGMPFWLRRWLARMWGMPENHKYARYFGIGCVPSRSTWKGTIRRRYKGDAYINFNRDEYLKMMRRYDSRVDAGRPYKGRYGGYIPLWHWRQRRRYRFT